MGYTYGDGSRKEGGQAGYAMKENKTGGETGRVRTDLTGVEGRTPTSPLSVKKKSE